MTLCLYFPSTLEARQQIRATSQPAMAFALVRRVFELGRR